MLNKKGGKRKERKKIRAKVELSPSAFVFHLVPFKAHGLLSP
jgi:hypothetical protein